MVLSIELVLSDFDGCIGPKGGGTKPLDTPNVHNLGKILGVMKAAPEKYPPFVICTGRAVPGIESHLQTLGAHFWPGYPSICEGGAAFYFADEKRTTWHYAIRNGALTELGKIFQTLKPQMAQIVEEELGGVASTGREYCLSVRPPKGIDILEWYKTITERFGRDALEITHTRTCVDITPKGVDKGSAIKQLAASKGIPIQNMLGIGDSKNDKPLLEVVGYPTGPSNATDDVESLLKYQSPFPEVIGVADILMTQIPGLAAEPVAQEAYQRMLASLHKPELTTPVVTKADRGKTTA